MSKPDESIKFMDAHVMFVDDEPAAVQAARQHLEPVLGPMVGFMDPVAALRHLESGERYEALVARVGMTPVSGLDLLRAARQSNPFVQVLLMADPGTYEMAARGLHLGAIDFTTRPVFDWEALGRSVRRALGERDLKIERARLLKELMQRNEELRRGVDLLRKAHEISEAMHASQDVGAVLNILLKTATDLLEARRVSIMIRDPSSDEMAIRLAEGVGQAVMEHIRVRPHEGVAGRVIAEGEPLVVDDATQDERVPQSAGKKGRYEGKAFMCVPIYLSGRDKVMGVVNITERKVDRPFSDMETEFAVHLGRQAAYALMNAALWKTRRQ